MFLLAWSFSDRCGLARPACPAMERPMGLYLTCWTWWLLGYTTLINIIEPAMRSIIICQIICLFNLVAIEAPSRKVVKCCIMGMQCFFDMYIYIYITSNRNMGVSENGSLFHLFWFCGCLHGDNDWHMIMISSGWCEWWNPQAQLRSKRKDWATQAIRFFSLEGAAPVVKSRGENAGFNQKEGI